MIESPDCPACGGSDWEHIGDVEFLKNDEGRNESCELGNCELGNRVLFELWQPNAEVFQAKFVLCRDCGFVCYTPRATLAEVAAKLSFLDAQRMLSSKKAEVTELDRQRSNDLYAYLRNHVEPATILDVGGGRGGLLSSFHGRGFECYIVDHVLETVRGVARLGATLDDLEDDAMFDLIVCSNVFQRLADPVDVARQLCRRLRPSGKLFVEVPLEILGGPPRMREPVTHVNFFSESSLSTALHRAGFSIVDCRTVACKTENATYRYSVRAIVVPTEPLTELELPGSEQVEKILKAGALDKFGRALSQPRMLWGSAMELSRRVPKKFNLGV